MESAWGLLGVLLALIVKSGFQSLFPTGCWISIATMAIYYLLWRTSCDLSFLLIYCSKCDCPLLASSFIILKVYCGLQQLIWFLLAYPRQRRTEGPLLPWQGPDPFLRFNSKTRNQQQQNLHIFNFAWSAVSNLPLFMFSDCSLPLPATPCKWDRNFL